MNELIEILRSMSLDDPCFYEEFEKLINNIDNLSLEEQKKIFDMLKEKEEEEKIR